MCNVYKIVVEREEGMGRGNVVRCQPLYVVWVAIIPNMFGDERMMVCHMYV